jgi:hypothetical protein
MRQMPKMLFKTRFCLLFPHLHQFQGWAKMSTWLTAIVIRFAVLSGDGLDFSSPDSGNEKMKSPVYPSGSWIIDPPRTEVSLSGDLDHTHRML